MKINLGSGMDYREGFCNVDMCKDIKIDILHDLNVYPYPFQDDSADVIVASHIIEHMDDPMRFMEECYRILKENGKLIIDCPIGGTWASYHLNHKYNLSPYSFKIIEPKDKWAFQFPFKFKIDKMRIFMPVIKEKIGFPWRFLYINCFVNNVFTKMRVELIKLR